MNEEAIKDAYKLFKAGGYNGSQQDFLSLISTNSDARKDAFNLFSSAGYSGGEAGFSGLLGLSSFNKKKEESALPLDQGSTLSATPGTEPPKPSAFSQFQKKDREYVPFAGVQPVESKAKSKEFQKAEKEKAIKESKKGIFKDVAVNPGDLVVVQDKGISKVTRDYEPLKAKADQLQEKYGDLGFKFEANKNYYQGEDIFVTSDDGTSISINTSSINENNSEDANKLQEFLFSKSAGQKKRELTPEELLIYSKRDDYQNISKAKYDRIYTDENIKKSLEFTSKKISAELSGLKESKKELYELEAKIQGMGDSAPQESLDDYASKLKMINSKVEDIKASSNIADIAIKNIIAERNDREKDKGSAGWAMYNSLVSGVESLTKGVVDVLVESSDMLSMGAMDKEKKGDQVKIIQELISSDFDYIKARNVTEEYLRSQNLAMTALFGVGETLPALLVPGGALARVSAMTVQGIGRRMDEYENSPEMQAMASREEFFLISALKSVVEAKLENVGITQAFSKSGLANSLVIKALQKWSPKMGNKALNGLVNMEINNLAAKAALNTAGAFIAESETGALQNMMETSINELYNVAKEKKVFDQPKVFTKDWIEGVGKDALMEGLGGVWMGGAVNVARYTAEGVLGAKLNNEEFELVREMLSDGFTAEAMMVDLKNKVINGQMTQKEMVQTVANFRKAAKIVDQMPDGELSLGQQRVAFDLINERTKLEGEIAGKDPNLVSKKKNRINEINERLKFVSENAVQEQTTSEVPAQPETAVGEETTQAGPEVVTEEEVVITEDAKEYAKDLEETKSSDPEQYWSVDSVSEESANEGTVITDEDGGVVVSKDGDIKGLFKRVSSKAKGVAQKLLQKAIDAGGMKLDNFDTYLTPIYKKAGFRVVSRIPFNEEFAPEGWNKEKHGTPDVVAMVYDPNNQLEIEERTFEDYDEAMAYRNSYVEQARANTGQQQTVAAEQGTPTTIEGTGLRENIKKSIAKVFKKFEVKSFKNAKEMAAYAKATYNQETGANDAARVFVGENGVEVLVNEELSDDTALGHEVWHALLLKAFGDNQQQFAAFRGAINKTLRENGYEDIADSLDEFSSQYTEDGEVPAEEYLAQLGGLMTSANIDLKNLKPAQRTLLEQIKDIINEFAVKLTGQPVFLQDATAETILDFMSTMSDMMAKGEDISGFFVSPTKTDKNGNLPKPSSRAQKSLKDKNKQIEKNTKAKVQKGDNVSTRVPSKGNPHSNSDLIVSTNVIIDAAKTDKGAKDYALKLAKTLAQYPNVNINKDSIKTLEDAQNVFEKFKENAKSNLKWLYDQFSDEVRTITKLWYDGANIVSNEIAKEYGYTTNQVSGVMAVLSPQMDWFRNLSLGKRVIDIYNTKKESTIDDKMEEYIRNANTGTGKKASPLFEGPAKKLTEKSIDLLIKEMKGKKFKDMSIPEKAFFVRAYDEVYSTRDYENISPTGDINGFVMTEKGARAKVGWGGFGPIMKAISILEDGNVENISKNLGNQHKVRNFFVNISNPNDANAVTIDTHAVAAALLKPLAGSDAEVNTNLSGPPKSASTGLVGSYPILADAYRELAKELGILPRELQSITWEAVRGLYKASFKTAKNKKAINEIWERYRNGEITINQLYEEVNTKAGGVSKPVWYEYVAEGNVKVNEENSAAIDQGKLSDDYGGERPESNTTGPEVTTRAQKVSKQIKSLKREDVIKLAKLTGVEANWDMRGEGDFLSGTKGIDAYTQRMLPGWNRKNQLGEIDPNSELTYDFVKGSYGSQDIKNVIEAKDEDGTTVALIKMDNDGGILHLAVAPEFRGKGVSEKLYEVLKQNNSNVNLSKTKNRSIGFEKSLGAVAIEEAYIKAKKDQSNPELVRELENLISVSSEAKTRAQKAQPNTIPGYDRMIGEAKSIVEKSRKRRVSAAQITENVLNYIQGSAVYERADDLQREQIIRDARKELGLRQRSAPSVDRLLGKIKDIKKVTVTEKSALKELLKAEAKGARTAVQARSQAAKALNDILKKLEKKGSIKSTQVRAIMTRYSKVNFFSSSSMDNFVNYMAKVFSDAEYNDKLKTASKTANSVRRLIKNPSLQAGTKAIAKKFLDIDPRLVEDIDKYLEFAKALNEAVRTSTSVTVDGDIDVILKKAIDYNEFQDYMDVEIAAQEEYIKNQLAEIHKDLVDAGVIDASMSLADMKAIIDAIKSDNKDTLPSEEKERMIRAYLGSVMDSYTGLIQYMLDNSMDPFSLELVSISQSDRDIISRFINMDINKLGLKDAYSVVEAIENFIVNKNVDNMGSILKTYEGDVEAEILQKAGTKARPVRSFFSKAFGRAWAEQIEQLQITMERMFGGVNAGIKVMRASGILDISQGKTKAVIQSEKILQKYTDKFGKIKNFSSAENIFERKIISFMKRTINGSDIQTSIEFERRKRIIEETIDAMENGSESERRDAAIARKVYDKVLKGAKNPSDVSNSAEAVNNEAVDFWIEEFENIFDELQSVSRSVYNTILERDINYTPDRFTRFDGEVDILDITSSSFASGNESYDLNKSGTLMVNNRIKTLGAKPSRVLSFDFDSDMSNAMLNALIDINTANAIRKVKGFYESDSFEKMVGNKEDLKLIKKRVKAFITKTKRKEYVPQSELAKGMKAANLLSQIAVGRALGSLAQIPKQTISVMANTMINSDGKLSFIDVINAKEFIDNSGYSIALRGIASNADVQTINKILERESESNAQEIQRGLNKAAEIWLNSFIARPDVWAARVSWITYYKESLRKQGIDADNIDWSTHEMNQEAGDYAQAQVNRQQNYSDSDFAGELLGSKDPMKAYFRKVLFPYMTFVFNQKSRQMADIAILSNKAASTEDKKIARKSLAGLAVEMGMYSLVGYFVKELYAAIVNAITGDEDEEEDKDKRLSNHLKYNSKAIINDLLSPIPNITDAPLDLAINKIMKISGLDEEKFSIPLDQDKSLAEVAIGPSSIIAEGALNLERMSYAAVTGVAIGEYKGKVYERQLSKEDQDLMKYVSVVYGAYLLGGVPADLGRLSEQTYRKLLKNSKKEKGGSGGIKTTISTKIK